MEFEEICPVSRSPGAMLVQSRNLDWSRSGICVGPNREPAGSLLKPGAVPSVPPMLNYKPRQLDALLADLGGAFPSVLINRPRATGRTTTARQLAASEVRLDQPGQAAGFYADRGAALRGRPEPLLPDGWQEVPELLGAVKRSVDDDPRPGRFILTGSVRSDLENKVWPGTGRLVRVQMYGLTQREIVGDTALAEPPVLDKIAMRSVAAFTLPAVRPDLRG